MRNKYQEALDNVMKDNPKAKLTISDIHKDIRLLLELVLKETPKKLSEAKIQYSIEIPAYIVVKTCPKCNRKFDYRNMGVNYCSICGQHLDWND